MKQVKARVTVRGISHNNNWYWSSDLYGHNGRDIDVILPDDPGSPLIARIEEAQFELLPIKSLG